MRPALPRRVTPLEMPVIAIVLGVLAGLTFIGLIYLVRLWPPRRRPDRP